MAEIIKTVIDVDINTSGAAAELRSLQQQINAFNLTLNKSQLEQGQASRVFAEGLKNSINAGGFFRAEVVKMQTAAGALDATLRKGQGTLGQFFSATFNKQGGMAAEVFALAAERARTMQTQFIATAKASKGMQEALAVRPLTAFSAEAAISAQRMQILNSMFKQGTTGLINFGKNVQWTGRQLMVGFTIPLTIFGTTAGKVFSDLEKQAVAFKKVYGDIFTTPVELEENFKAVQGLSREFTKYGIAAKDTLSLAAQAAAAGRKNTELTDAIRESTRLATLGQMDQNAALETTISLQSAFRLSGQELADTINFLNMVENQTVVSLQDIAAAIPRVAPVIKGLGGDVKDLTVFLAAMQEGGVSAEQGANALKSGLGSLINPTKAATEVLSGFKINLDSIIQTNRGDLMGTVMAFSQALSTLDEFSRQQALESIFGKFQYARLGALFENISREGSQAQQVISTLGYSTEQLAKSAEKELTTVEQAFSTQLTGAIERLKIAIAPLGEIFVKMAIPLVNMVTRMVESFNRLPEGVKNITALAAALGGVLLPAATMIFGLFSNLIGTFAKFSHSIGMFGVTLVKKGPIAAIKSLTQSANYLSLSEIDAANAARQLGSATEIANAALLSQVGSANSADIAIKNLTNSYRVLISEQTRASQVQPFLFGTGQAAGNLAGGNPAANVAATMATRGRSRIKAVGLNQGGSVFTPKNSNTVPGVGNTDTVPAMLTPGEFVVNKESTQKNLGLLHAINDSQKLNIGGKVKNGIQYAMAGFQIGNTPGYSAATNAVAAKLARAGQSAVSRTRGTPRTSGQATQLKNNFVYLLNPTNNQQLTGVRTMKGFDKRGVPLDVLKQDMVSEEGLWMIDALAKGDWKKDAYRLTLENNFASIAAKYPGKEIRFLDSAGLERVQPLLGKPEYQNVQFVSVKDLQNKDLLDNLTPDHLDRLMTDATQVTKELRTSKSRGTTSLKDTYKGIPGMESYTKIMESWRGTSKPKGRQGAHMYNGGGVVTDSDLVLKAFSTGRGPANRVHSGRPTGIGLDKIVSSIWKKSASGSQKRENLLVKNGIPKPLIKQILKIEDPIKAAEILRQNNFGFYSTGFAGGTSLVSGRHYNMFTEELRKIADPPIGEGKPGPEASKNLAKKLPRHILEGNFPLTKDDFDNVIKQFEQYGKTLEPRSEAKREFNKLLKVMSPFKSLTKEKYEKQVIDRMNQVQKSVGGNPKHIDWIFKNLPKNYTPEDVLDRIYDINNPSFKAEATKGKFELKSEKTNIGQLSPGTTVRSIFAKVRKPMGRGRMGLLPMFGYAFNKGGMIPGVQYLIGGGKAIFEKGGVKVPEVMRGAFGLTSRNENEAVELMKSGFSTYDAGATMKAFQTGHIKLDISGRIKKAKNIDEYIQQKIEFEKSQYSLTKEMVRDLYKTKRLPKAKQQKILDEWNKNRLNKGGMVPGVQYFSRGGIAGFIDQIKAKMALRKLVSGRASGSQMRGGDTRGWNMPGIYMTKDKFSASNYAALAEKSVGTYGPGSLYSFKPKGPISVLNMRGKITKEQRQGLVDAIRKTDADDAYKKVVIDALQKAKTLDEARIIARSIPFRTTDLDRVSQLSTSLRDDVNNIIGLNNPADDFILNFNSSRSLDRKNIRLLDKKLNEMKSSGQYAPSIGSVNLEDDINQAIIKNKNKFKITETKIDSKKIPGAKKSTQRLLDSFGFDPLITGYSQAARDPRALKLFIESILKPGQFNPGTREQLAEILFGTYGIKNLKSTNLFNKLSGIKRERVPEGVLLNKGNIVPGVGNTDTVPAMLTPGEFVINKESTKQNYDLLTAINSGKIKGYNKGGKIPGIQYFAEENPQRVVQPLKRGAVGVGMGAGLIASMAPLAMTEQLGTFGSMAASLVAFEAARKGATAAFNKVTGNSKILAEQAKAAGTAAKGMNLKLIMTTKILGMAAGGWLTLITSVITIGVVLTKLSDNIKNSGQKLSKAMYGSADRVEGMAKALGRTTASQQILQQQADLIAGQRSTPEVQQMSSQFMQTEQGSTLLNDIKTVKKMGGDAVTALRNQLGQAVLAGIMTPEEARQIAVDIGIALKDEKIAIQASAQISQLFGADGKKLKDNRLSIMTKLMAPTNINEIQEQTNKAFEKIQGAGLNPFAKGYSFGDAIQSLVAKTNPEYYRQQMGQSALQENIIQNALREKEIRSQINLEYQQGLITFSKYKEEIAILNNNQFGSNQVESYLKDLPTGLKLNAAAGAQGSGIAFQGIGALISGAGAIENNNTIGTGTMPVRGRVRDPRITAAEDFVNKQIKAVNKEMTSLGFDEKEQQDLLKFVTQEFGKDLAKQATLFGEILSGEMSLATLAFIQNLPKDVQEFIKKNTGTDLITASKAMDPLIGSPLQNVATDILKGTKEGYQQGTLTDIKYVESLAAKYKEISALPPEIIKVLKIDLGSEEDIANFAPKTQQLKENWNLLNQLPASINKETFFKINAVDANGNPIEAKDLAEIINKTWKAYNDLDSTNPKVRKEAQIAIYKTVNDSQVGAEKAIEEAKKQIKDFDKLPKEVQTNVLMSFATIGLEQVMFAAEVAKWIETTGTVPAEVIAEGNKRIREAQSAANQAVAGAIAGGFSNVEEGAESALQSAIKSARQTKEVIAAQAKLLAAGISIDALEGLSPEAIIDLSKKSGKELRNNIKLFNEQAESIKVNRLVLEQLALEENPIKKALEDSKKIVEGYDDQIKELNKTIEKSNRADELDRRRIEDRNKALENLTKKEKNVNDQYDERIKALDKVANANDRVAERQRQQIDLATALTSGDIAGAAQAAAAMTQTGAQNQIEDTKTALEAQRQAELDGLTESVNGKLMSRKDIEAEINAIEETIYQRSINLRTTNDEIYNYQLKINSEKERQDELNRALEAREKELAKKVLDKLKDEKGITLEKKKQTDETIKAAYIAYTGKGKGIGLEKYKKDILGLAFGGMVKKYAYGGNVGYKGSKEAPPMLKMARGSLVPGLGNTDRVPALLTPGEFVVRKSVAQANMPLLKALNSDVFPTMSLNTPEVAPTVTSSTSTILNNTPVYNYSISVNVPNTTASPDEIANVVVSRIKRSMDTNIRSNRY